MKELLRFNKIEGLKTKTEQYWVFSNHSGDCLGRIHWRAGWRCYVMSYCPDVDMSLSCNKELNDFMEKLEMSRDVSKVKEVLR